MAAVIQPEEERAAAAVTEVEESDDPFAEFVIMDRKYDKKEAPCYLTLMDSASFSDYEVDFYLNKTQEMYDHEYSVLIKGIPETFPPGIGVNKAIAQNRAAEKALQVLSRHCYTVKYKEHKEVLLTDILDEEATLSVPPVPQPLEYPVAENASCGSVPPVPQPLEYPVAENASCGSGPPVPQPLEYSVAENTSCGSGPPVPQPLEYPVAENTSFGSVPDEMSKSSPQGDVVQVDAGCDSSFQTERFPSTMRNMSSVSAGPDTVGSKMLKMMGWDGGGLGKDGRGITEPIKSPLVLGRFGLGHSKRKQSEEIPKDVERKKAPGRKLPTHHDRLCSTQLKKKKPNTELRQPKPVSLKKITDNRFEGSVRNIIGNFIEKSQDQELVFSKRLSNLQRKIIHDIASVYNLSSISFGLRQTRHLVLFREHTVDDFLQNLCDRARKDTNINYQIIPPSENHPVHFS